MAYFRTREFVARFGEIPKPQHCVTAPPGRVISGFAAGSTRVPASEWSTLVGVARRLGANPGYKITLVGHADADDTGDPASNHKLGLDRAIAVLRLLKSLARDVTLKRPLQSRGASCPVGKAVDDDDRSANRRVDIFFSPPKGRPNIPPLPTPPSPPQPRRPPHPPHMPQPAPSGPGLELERPLRERPPRGARA